MPNFSTILATALVLAAIVPFAAGTGPESLAPFVVTGETIWENGTFLAERPIVVAAGGTLVIRDAHVRFVAPHACVTVPVAQYCEDSIAVHADGRLVVERSRLESGSAHDLSTFPIVWVLGAIEVRESVLERFDTIRIEQPTASGIFERNLVRGWLGELGFWRGASGIASDNAFEEGFTAIGVQDASPAVIDNTFTHMIDRAIRVQASAVGSKLWTTAPLIEGNTFHGGTTALAVLDAAGGFPVRENNFEGAKGTAITLRLMPRVEEDPTTLAPVIEGNRFAGNQNVLRVSTRASNGPAPMHEVSMQGNAIEGTICSLVEALPGSNAPLHVDARGNWWGHAEGPMPDGACTTGQPLFTGDVAYAPWLTSPP